MDQVLGDYTTDLRDGVVAGPGHGDLRILLLEDDEIDAAIAERLIDKLPGAKIVQRVGCLGDAIDAIQEFEASVILGDLTLPDATGLETVRTLVTEAPLVPLIVLSGLDNDDLADAALELGAQDYLVKGECDRARLGQALRHAVSRNRLHARLVQSRTDLAEANERLANVTGVLAHDLRAPIRSARLFTDRLFTRHGYADPIVIEHKRRVDEAHARIEGLISSILEFESIRTGAIELRPTNLAETIDDARDLVTADLLEANARCATRVDRDLRVMADNDLLVRVMLNLLGNSIKYRRPDVACEIEITARVVDDQAIVSVSDNGMGVPTSERERVFRMAERLVGSSVPGLGFGLPVCRRIIGAFGGSMEIVPSDTPGTTVAFNLVVATER